MPLVLPDRMSGHKPSDKKANSAICENPNLKSQRSSRLARFRYVVHVLLEYICNPPAPVRYVHVLHSSRAACFIKMQQISSWDSVGCERSLLQSAQMCLKAFSKVNGLDAHKHRNAKRILKKKTHAAFIYIYLVHLAGALNRRVGATEKSAPVLPPD